MKRRKRAAKTKTRIVYVARKTRRKSTMARRRYYAKGRSSGGGFGGGIKSMIAPIAGGAADNIIDNYIPINGVGGVVVGMFMRHNTTRDIGLYKVGYSLGNYIPIGNKTTNQGGML